VPSFGCRPVLRLLSFADCLLYILTPPASTGKRNHLLHLNQSVSTDTSRLCFHMYADLFCACSPSLSSCFTSSLPSQQPAARHITSSHVGGFLAGLFPAFLYLPNFKHEVVGGERRRFAETGLFIKPLSRDSLMND
jgi:hypothetical protein